jgi:hypothetical protein
MTNATNEEIGDFMRRRHTGNNNEAAKGQPGLRNAEDIPGIWRILHVMINSQKLNRMASLQSSYTSHRVFQVRSHTCSISSIWKSMITSLLASFCDAIMQW